MKAEENASEHTLTIYDASETVASTREQQRGTIVHPPIDLILGHMPFIGVSYQSRVKDNEYKRIFSHQTAIREVIDAAIDFGIQRFAATTKHSSPLAASHLGAIRSAIDRGYSMEIIPCIEIPLGLGANAIDPYRRWATYIHIENSLYPEAQQRIIHDPIMKFRENWKRRLTSSKPYEEDKFLELAINWKVVDKDLQFFMQLPANHIEFGSETDFLAMTGRFDLLGELVDQARSHGFSRVSLGIHHAGLTIPLIEEHVKDVGYVTPINPLGIMMFPTKLSAEEAVRRAEGTVIAIKPLAGGRVQPEVAYRYLAKLPIEGFMVGVGSVAELRENVDAAREALHRIY